jgi:hypothetical protein
MSGEQVGASLLQRRRELAIEGHRAGRWSDALLAGSEGFATIVEIGPTDAEWCTFLDRADAFAKLQRLHVVE